ncbi:GntR family transcriptional regulator/MocR family aminotransferase [Aquimarina sp. EL_43]|uniref:MocR-like pyridoxine biosynthesis transcription factor PdxR n=1 Tax=unclassified Aquimarina TaxID=2627091 RepID=UPI0018CA76BE|nr:MULTISPECIES: PLP-dependent aminotransferase family protein [unclassified Aquimarina]MBG6129789.1 GntR family transcriptional regulator/MocR family aminotransferase [Aquimarina sp. EL_35]MBG6150854.1 GntR family transcriptional regulator/MocR family aminotransferase [Aquimarina sp. EL_32]MBG6167839.1 GntR family transcriptional regulator/MocR family aminotransferase [Aquimarina sp. EL_43]
MFPFKNNIVLVRDSNRNLYLQLCDQIIGFIKSGKLPPSTKLPGSRKLAEALNVHRKTVISAYEELISQGWVETIPTKGTFVTSSLPIINPKNFVRPVLKNSTKEKSGFSFLTRSHLVRKPKHKTDKKMLVVDDGCPDHRLAPIEEIAKVYRNITKKSHHENLLTYGSTYGNLELRKNLVTYLNQTRGLHITVDNILITRGSQMGIYLNSQLLLSAKNKVIVVGNTNYMTADNTFKEAGARIEQVPVDDQGLDTNAIEKLCKIKQINAVYTTSHHHHPTTVTLSAERRMHLLQLAQYYNFAIIEDDYDYDFHYNNAPILPLASNDDHGNVIYIGGFTKIIAPAIRIGYLVASKDFVDEAARLRRIIDRQGDTLLEQTLAQMISTGDVQRHCNKVLKIYKTRRDLFCSLLKEKLGNYFDFEIPKGGMAIWVKLNKAYNWDVICNEAEKLDIELNPDWRRYDNDNSRHNGIRMGFASLNEEEILEVIERLVKVFEFVKQNKLII